MKTNEELNALKEEVETLSKKLAELNEDELKQVAGGWTYWMPKEGPDSQGKWPYSKEDPDRQGKWPYSI